MRFVPHQVFSWFSRLSSNSICVSLACIYHLNKIMFPWISVNLKHKCSLGGVSPHFDLTHPIRWLPACCCCCCCRHRSPQIPTSTLHQLRPWRAEKNKQCDCNSGSLINRRFHGYTCRSGWSRGVCPALNTSVRHSLPSPPSVLERGLNKWWSCCEGHTYLIARPKSSKFLDSNRKTATISVRPVMT